MDRALSFFPTGASRRIHGQSLTGLLRGFIGVQQWKSASIAHQLDDAELALVKRERMLSSIGDEVVTLLRDSFRAS